MAAPGTSASTSSGSSANLQYAFRAEKTMGMVACAPSWSTLDGFGKPDGQIRTSCYSANGAVYAVASTTCVYLFDATKPQIQLIKEVPAKNTLEISLSPQGTYLLTWCRPVRLEGGAQHKNLEIWATVAAEEATAPADDEVTPVIAFTHKEQETWKVQFTEDESFALRSNTNEIQVLQPSSGFSIAEKLRIENLTSFSLSPGRNPAVAVFVAEKKGMPASVAIHSLSTLQVPSIRKSFYKADNGQMKWNSSGTSLLFLSSTDHDKTGKSYYGETNLYLMTPALQYEARVVLDKEGGIGDFAWNPANGGKEFAVSYGFMPAKTTLFDTRLNVLHDFGALPRNFVSFNPQGRLLCIAGFGNLAGAVDIWDRSTLKKVASFQANNCTECTWSPDGRLIMASTLSPRLRVDNGVKLYHWSGELIHVQLTEELYQVAWRPIPASQFTFPRALSPAPTPSPAAKELLDKKRAANGGSDAAASPKPVAVGAYRPPGLRNREVPSIFKREDEGGVPSTPAKTGIPGMPQANGGGSSKGRARTVPGAGPPADGQGKKGNNQKKNQNRNGGAAGASAQQNLNQAVSNMSVSDASGSTPRPQQLSNGAASQGEANSTLTPEEKKRRALVKKLGAIEALKAKRAAGEKLEKTQEKKIEAEEEVRKELKELQG